MKCEPTAPDGLSRPEDGKIVVGVVSDTHDLLRPQVLESLRGVDHIIHAGDVCNPEILEQFNAIAPVTAVRGNCDKGSWSLSLPEWEVFSLGGVHLYVIHNLNELDLDPQAAGFAAVIYGHTHVPKQEYKRDVCYLNPGSIGPRRFNLPISYARLTIDRGCLEVEFVEIT